MGDLNFPRDKSGRQIMPGDTLKVYHFTAALRRERRYMYKFVTGVENNRLTLSHLSLPFKTGYSQAMDGRQLTDHEIVQGYAGVELGQDFTDRPKDTGESK